MQHLQYKPELEFIGSIVTSRYQHRLSSIEECQFSFLTIALSFLDPLASCTHWFYTTSLLVLCSVLTFNSLHYGIIKKILLQYGGMRT